MDSNMALKFFPSTSVEAVYAVASLNNVSEDNTVNLECIQDPHQYVGTSVPTPYDDFINFSSDGVGQLVAASIQVFNSDDKPIKKKRSYNKKNTVTHACPHCSKTFSNRIILADHLRTHTGERPYSCQYCGLQFSQMANRRTHERLHIGLRPHVCQICGKTFTRSTHLTGHIRIHTGERPFSCDYCAQAFISAQQKKIHMRKHTGDKPWQCNICEAKFNHSSTLSTHKRKKHFNDKPRKCTICSKDFMFPYDLKNHMAVHSGVPITCDMCNRTFSHAQSLATHKKKHCPCLKSSQSLSTLDLSGKRPKRKYTKKSKGDIQFADLPDGNQAVIIKQETLDDTFFIEHKIEEEPVIKCKIESNPNPEMNIKEEPEEFWNIIEENEENGQDHGDIVDDLNLVDNLVMTIESDKDTEEKRERFVPSQITFGACAPLKLILSESEEGLEMKRAPLLY